MNINGTFGDVFEGNEECAIGKWRENSYYEVAEKLADLCSTWRAAFNLDI